MSLVAEFAMNENAGVGKHHINPAETLQRALDHVLNVGRLRHIGANDKGLAGDLSGDRLHLLD